MEHVGIIDGPRARGIELVGELVRYENSYRLCYVRGPEGIIVELAEKIGDGSGPPGPSAGSQRASAGAIAETLRGATREPIEATRAVRKRAWLWAASRPSEMNGCSA
jgi:hypothetical protein